MHFPQTCHAHCDIVYILQGSWKLVCQLHRQKLKLVMLIFGIIHDNLMYLVLSHRWSIN